MLLTSTESNERMVCSREFALWLLQKNRESGEPEEKWFDVILKYCNLSCFKDLFQEMTRKSMELTYSVYEENEEMVAVPSYELVELKAYETACEDNIHPVTYFCDYYAVLTTGACFPGKKQAPEFMTRNVEPNDLKRTIMRASYQVYCATVVSSFTHEDAIRLIRSGEVNLREGCPEKMYTLDAFGMQEFEMAQEKDFLDHLSPYSFGPMCPDRQLSAAAVYNCMRGMMRSFWGWCADKGIWKELQGIYLAALYVTAVKHLIICHTDRIPLEKLLLQADERYEALLKAEGTGSELQKMDEEMLIFMSCGNQLFIADMEDLWEEDYEMVREQVLENREHAMDGYLSVMDRFGAMDDDSLTDDEDASGDDDED